MVLKRLYDSLPALSALDASGGSCLRHLIFRLLGFAFWAILWASPVAAQSPNMPISALPVLDGGETQSFFIVELNSGQTTQLDRLRRDPLAPRTQRSDNIFQQIGRPSDPPAKVGEILFGPILTSFSSAKSALVIESSTGYVAYFEQLNKGRLGTLTNAMGRPFGPLANPDGNFALLMRRNGSGSTEGAYLYHATTGNVLYLSEVEKLSTEPVMFSTDSLPQFPGPVAAVPLLSNNQETYAFLILDCGSGNVHYASLVSGTPETFNVRQLDLNLKEAFGSSEAPAELGRLSAVGLQNSDEATSQVLLLDPKSGDFLALDLSSLPASLRFTKSSRNFYAGQSSESSTGRYFTPIPHHDGEGLTVGVYFWDSATRNLFYVNEPFSLNTLTPRVVRMGG